MDAATKNELNRLTQFVTLAYCDSDINEQYRGYKKEKSAGGETPNGLIKKEK